MASHPRLPLELTDIIIDKLKAIQDDSSDSDSFCFRSFAFVCKDWLPRVRYHGFSSLTRYVPQRDDFLSNIAMIQNHPAISTYIQHLELDGGDKKVFAYVHDIFELLQALPNLRTLVLRNMSLDYRWHSKTFTAFNTYFQLEKLVLYQVSVATHDYRSLEVSYNGGRKLKTIETALDRLLSMFSSLKFLEFIFVTLSHFHICKRECKPLGVREHNLPRWRKIETLAIRMLYTPFQFFWPALSRFTISKLILEPFGPMDADFLFGVRDHGSLAIRPQSLTLRLWHILGDQYCSESDSTA